MFWITGSTDTLIDISTSTLINGIKNLVFLVRSDIINAELISNHIKKLNKLKILINCDITVIITPNKSSAFNLILENNEVIGDLTIHEWNLGFIQLRSNLLSLEYGSNIINDLYLNNISTPIYKSAIALHYLYKKFPKFLRFNHLLAKGNNSVKLLEMYERISSEYEANLSPEERLNNYQIDNALYGGSGLHSNRKCELIIIERSVDFITPLLTQLTYEGLIDEFYGISSNQVEVPNSVVSLTSNRTPTTNSNSNSNSITIGSSSIHDKKTRKITLNSTDSLFNEIRDLNFSQVGLILNKKARFLQNELETRHSAKTVSAIKEFVNKLGPLQQEQNNLKIHTNLAGEIMKKFQLQLTVNDPSSSSNLNENENENELIDSKVLIFNKNLEIQQNMISDSLDLNTLHSLIEELIYQSSSIEIILRLLCLETLSHNGIQDKNYQFFKKNILQTYGYKHILTFQNLFKLKLLYSKSYPPKSITIRDWITLRSKLSLISDEQNDDEIPKDITFSYSGYAPLSIRLIQGIFDKSIIKSSAFLTSSSRAFSTTGWKGLEDITKCISGDLIDKNPINIHTSSITNKTSTSTTTTTQTNTSTAVSINTPSILSNISLKNKQQGLNTCVLFFLGGITFAEVAALNFYFEMLKKNGDDKQFIIATTGIINGNQIVSSAIET